MSQFAEEEIDMPVLNKDFSNCIIVDGLPKVEKTKLFAKLSGFGACFWLDVFSRAHSRIDPCTAARGPPVV